MKAGATFFFLFVLALTSSCERQEEARPVRILVAGISHESNTFNPHPTAASDFTVRRGAEVLERAEWAQAMDPKEVEFVPTLIANARPSGVVARATYEGFRDAILAEVRDAGKLDGIYLVLHGALHVEGYDDAQVDFLRRLRKLTGDVLIAASFDLHGNISPELVNELNILTAYRTAPHVDGPETRLRAVTLLLEAIQRGLRPATAHINVPILIPGEKGITSVEPLKSLYERLPKIVEIEGLMDASIFVGMPWTDVPRAGMSVQVVAQDASYTERAQREVVALASELWRRRSELQFDVPTDDIDGAIQTAREAPEPTVFITDSGDNTTAGAAGDGTLVLERLLAQRVEDAVVAGIVDPEAVETCVRAGVGAPVDLIIGGKIDAVFSRPLTIHGDVRFIAPEPTAGSRRRPVVLQVDGIQLVLLKESRSFTSPRDFEEVEIDPLAHEIVVVKLGYLFQALRDIAPRTIMALTPGFASQTVENLEYKSVRRPIFPLDPDMEWNPSFP